VDFAEGDKCTPVLLTLSLVGNLEKPLMSLYGTEWREPMGPNGGSMAMDSGAGSDQTKSR
jgi:hypothetical protein